MNSTAKKLKLGIASFLSLGAALLVVVGVQSQDKNYSVSKSVGDVVSSCWGTQVANAQDGAGLVWDKNNVGCGDPWNQTDSSASDGDGDACGDASPDSPDCGPL